MTVASLRDGTTRGSEAYGAIALRALAATGTAALLPHEFTSSALILLAVLVVLTIDTRNLLTLKNFVLVYALLVFGVGAGVRHLTGAFIFSDIVWYLLLFLGGYAIARMPDRHGGHDSETPLRPPGRGALRLPSLESALFVLVILNLFFLALQFLKYGVAGYYEGQGLLDQALTYGKASNSGGFQQIVRFALRDSGIALVILYVRGCFESSVRIRYKYPLALFVALPILSLNRFDAVVGALTTLVIYACDRRLSKRHSRAGGARCDETPAPLRRSRPKNSRVAVIILGMALAIVTAIFIASVRSGFAHQSGASGPPDRLAMFTSELDPAQAYGGIKTSIGVLGHPHGRTIVLPLLLKVVPRAWYPNKPLNSAAYYMSVVRPTEWAAGLAIPPTFFGDAYLNFGFGGALFASLLLGVVAGRLDLAYTRVNLRRLPLFLLVFANFYALLRDPLSESLAGIALMLLVWRFADKMFRSPSEAPN